MTQRDRGATPGADLRPLPGRLDGGEPPWPFALDGAAVFALGAGGRSLRRRRSAGATAVTAP